MFVVNCFTQRRRSLQSGFHLTWPWESPAVIHLPLGACVLATNEFPIGVLRYDPRPFAIMTQDRVNVNIDTYIDYRVAEFDVLLDRPDTNLNTILEDAVRVKLQELVSGLRLLEINSSQLAGRLSAIQFPMEHGLQIEHVGVQQVRFDPATETLLRAQATGASPEALQYSALFGVQNSVLTPLPGANSFATRVKMD
jgi:regulator of protease activity HflC (stomatin/prohibitin superfamily)